MKLVRFGEAGQERPGVWVEQADGGARILDVRAMAFDIDDYTPHFFTHWGVERVRNLLAEPEPKWVPAAGVRLGPPLPTPRMIVCLGANYAAHAKEFNHDVPRRPLLFCKGANAWNGPFDPIMVPAGCDVVDAEVELGVVLGRTAKDVPADQALQYVAGCLLLNDVSDRVAQRADGQWFLAKSYDTFCPAGPWLVTPDELGDPHRIDLSSHWNGAVVQSDSTGNMIFKLPEILAYISRRITLQAGDVIATGTPSGVGSLHQPPLTLQPGGHLELRGGLLGVQRNPIVAGD